MPPKFIVTHWLPTTVGKQEWVTNAEPTHVAGNAIAFVTVDGRAVTVAGCYTVEKLPEDPAPVIEAKPAA